MSGRFKNYINGKWVEAKSGKTFENRNPARSNDLIGLFPLSGPEDLDEAAGAAQAAFSRWRLVPAPKRGEILYRVGELLRQHKEEIARIMTREMGKVLKETRGDVQEGVDTAFYTAGEGRRLFGETTPSELPDKFAMSVRAPIGVCALITPWNFPMAIPTWKLFPALLCGNTVILKPAEDTPHTAVKLFEILEEAGVPPGCRKPGSWSRRGSRSRDGASSRCAAGFVYWIERRRSGNRVRMRPKSQACVTGIGREECPNRDGRCGSRSCLGRCAVGRLWHYRPALYGDEPTDLTSRYPADFNG
jgi:hypothetical protein